MTKAPVYIYLQISEEESFEEDTTWCEDQISEYDIEYIRYDEHLRLMNIK